MDDLKIALLAAIGWALIALIMAFKENKNIKNAFYEWFGFLKDWRDNAFIPGLIFVSILALIGFIIGGAN